jgi:adenosylcobyric acid synthase
LPTETVFNVEKLTVQRTGRIIGHSGLLGRADGLPVRGYEIRMGRVRGEACPALDLHDHTDGCVSEDGWVFGTSVHGLFANRSFRRAVLEQLAERKGVSLPLPAASSPDPFELLADALERCLDLQELDGIIGVRP